MKDVQKILEKEIKKYEFVREKFTNYGLSGCRIPWLEKSNNNFGKRFIKALKEYESFLDIGCGTGYMMKYISEKDTNNKVVGIDISKTAINNIKAEFKDELTVFEMNAIDLKFEDNEFNVVLHLDGLEHMPQEIEKKCILEAIRVANTKIFYSICLSESIEDKHMIENGLEPLHINLKTQDEWEKVFSGICNETGSNIEIIEFSHGHLNVIINKK